MNSTLRPVRGHGLSSTGAMILALLLGPASCTSAGTTHHEAATLQVSRLAPPPGATITEDAVLSAEIAYSIPGYAAGTEYTIMPVFAQAHTDGETFNEFPTGYWGVPVLRPAGTIHLSHPIKPEWRSGELATPVTVWIYLMVKKDLHHRSSLAHAGPFTYSAKGLPTK